MNDKILSIFDKKECKLRTVSGEYYSGYLKFVDDEAISVGYSTDKATYILKNQVVSIRGKQS